MVVSLKDFSPQMASTVYLGESWYTPAPRFSPPEPAYFLPKGDFMRRELVRCNSLVFASLVVMCISGFAGTFTTLHNFESNSYGANPRGTLIVDSAGNLYGTAENGGSHGFGDVYELIPLANGQYSQK